MRKAKIGGVDDRQSYDRPDLPEPSGHPWPATSEQQPYTENWNFAGAKFRASA